MNRPQSSRSDNKFQNGLLWLIAIAAAIWILEATFTVTMPLVAGFTLTLLLFPIQRATKAKAPPKLSWLGPIAALLVLLSSVAVFTFFLAWIFGSMAEEAPRYAERYVDVREFLGEYGVVLPELGNNTPGAEDDSPEATAPEVSIELLSFIGGSAIKVWKAVGLSVLVLFFTLMMLVEADAWERRTRLAMGKNGEKLLEIVDVMAGKVRAFLLLRTLVSFVTGTAAAVLFYVVGIDFWYLWGLLAFLLNYIPFVGSLIAAIPPVLLAFATKDWTIALLAAAGATAINTIIGSFIDPKIEGETLSVSPVVLLAGLVFWAWVWSWPGAILSIPLTTALVVVLAHTDDLKMAGLLLSDSENLEELDKDMSK